MGRKLLYLILFVLVMSGCTSAAQEPESTAAVWVTILPPTPPITAQSVDSAGTVLLPTPTAAFTQDNTPNIDAPPTPIIATPVIATQPPPPPSDSSEYTLGAAPGVPASLAAAAQSLANRMPQRFLWVDAAPGGPSPDILLTVNNGKSLAAWVYAVAAPFATVADGTSWEAVKAGWADGTSELGQLMVDPETAAALASTWGPSDTPRIVADDFIGQVWAARPSWIIVPFERLRPEFKVMSVAGQSPLARDFAPERFPLVLPITVTGEPAAVDEFLAAWDGPNTNYDPNKMTRVAMTGVTALVRATAAQMEQKGILWPGEEVAPVLQSADIAHISNEVSFAADCPLPDPYGGTTFCSRDNYFELIKHLGTDVIELTGNHLNDYGRQPLERSLDMYTTAGMQWFGGGRNLADAQRAAIFDHNGNRIAFVGCNPVGPPNGWALADAAGSRPCGPDLAAQITQLRDEGYIVIATLQYTEYYVYTAPPDQKAAFSELAAAGAAAVSGSQAHHAQGFAFENGSFIHYGPGNLFFDQMDMMGTRETFVDTYVIYDGRLLSVELWTGLIESWARPRLMTPAERAELLQTVFQASGW